VPNQRAVEANSTLPPLVLPQKCKPQAENSAVLPATSFPAARLHFLQNCVVRQFRSQRFRGAPKDGNSAGIVGSAKFS
jgi:hypothetical protein